MRSSTLILALLALFAAHVAAAPGDEGRKSHPHKHHGKSSTKTATKTTSLSTSSSTTSSISTASPTPTPVCPTGTAAYCCQVGGSCFAAGTQTSITAFAAYCDENGTGIEDPKCCAGPGATNCQNAS
ncbi:hypothetical protein BDY17DRAFT_24886 [Neohortaea acidophila]|uniref:Uncharacterized protein n=1 Tax=Neohortaea acidophila TaxID=245834 RepID=A0A6A6Q6T5_9PEZI|nr:uncharacterized protein BDY17DRAFT_24886 [Neohortaea acidophila]KAF2488158.1 hypothetical protein BDY17DRAFT_24886 [Neohortaea acidophila]